MALRFQSPPRGTSNALTNCYSEYEYNIDISLFCPSQQVNTKVSANSKTNSNCKSYPSSCASEDFRFLLPCSGGSCIVQSRNLPVSKFWHELGCSSCGTMGILAQISGMQISLQSRLLGAGPAKGSGHLPVGITEDVRHYYRSFRLHPRHKNLIWGNFLFCSQISGQLCNFTARKLGNGTDEIQKKYMQLKDAHMRALYASMAMLCFAAKSRVGFCCS